MIVAFCLLTGLIIAAIGSIFVYKGRGYKQSSINKMIAQGSRLYGGGGLFTPRGPHLHPTKDKPVPELRNNKMILLGALIMAIGFALIAYGFYSVPPYASPK